MLSTYPFSCSKNDTLGLKINVLSLHIKIKSKKICKNDKFSKFDIFIPINKSENIHLKLNF